MKVLSPTSGLQAWGLAMGGDSRESDFECQQGLITDSMGLGKQKFLEGRHKVLCAPGPRGKSSDFIGDWSRPASGVERREPSYTVAAATAAAKSLQSCPTLCDPIDGSLPGSPSLGFSRQEYWSGVPLPSLDNISQKNFIWSPP